MKDYCQSARLPKAGSNVLSNGGGGGGGGAAVRNPGIRTVATPRRPPDAVEVDDLPVPLDFFPPSLLSLLLPFPLSLLTGPSSPRLLASEALAPSEEIGASTLLAASGLGACGAGAIGEFVDVIATIIGADF